MYIYRVHYFVTSIAANNTINIGDVWTEDDKRPTSWGRYN